MNKPIENNENSAFKQQKEHLFVRLDDILRKSGIMHGIPLGFGREDLKLVGHTRDKKLAGLLDTNMRDQKPLDFKKLGIRNYWKMSRPLNGEYGYVIIGEDEEGCVQKVIFPARTAAVDRANMWLDTGATRIETTLVEAEERARNKLKPMLSDRQWSTYVLTESLIERGQSGVLYLLRKSRPTIAIRAKGPLDADSDEDLHTIGTLCMHPMAYYQGTWAGALPPSDEVIAHLLFIRTDEYDFWKKANHIPIDDPRSGI